MCVERFDITRCLCNANHGTRRESRHAMRISGTRGEFRACGANLGHFRCSSDRQIRHAYIFYLGLQSASRHISESSTGRESGTRLAGGGVGRSLARLCC
jgi:hypothetical protein